MASKDCRQLEKGLEHFALLIADAFVPAFALLLYALFTRIALRVQKSTESKIILDEVGAESLLGKGDMLLKGAGSQTQRSHGYLLNANDISKYFSRT